MNTHHALQEAVHQFPNEDTPGFELIDFEMEFMNCKREEAELHVELLRAAAHQAAQLTEATNLLASNTRSVRALKAQIQRHVRAPRGGGGGMIVLTVGGREPVLWVPLGAQADEGHGATITVGAAWVLFEWGLRVGRERCNRRAAYARRKQAR